MSSLKSPLRQPTIIPTTRSVYAALAQFPIVCFTLALLTDITYWQTSYLMWAEFSAWLLLAGIVTGVLAAVFGAIDFLVGGEVRAAAWPHAIGGALVLILAFANNLVHAGDGWSSVVPWGLTLSALTVLVILATASFGGSPGYGHDVGVRK
jgi:uncharacterized membrane protein